MSLQEPTNVSHSELVEATNASGFFQLLGMHIEVADVGKGKVSIRVDERLMHPQMIVHGGVTFALADSAMGMTLLAALSPETRIGTIEAKVNFLLPVRAGELVAEARIVHLGRTIAVLEATVFNIVEDEPRAVARMIGSFSISESQRPVVAE